MKKEKKKIMKKNYSPVMIDGTTCINMEAAIHSGLTEVV